MIHLSDCNQSTFIDISIIKSKVSSVRQDTKIRGVHTKKQGKERKKQRDKEDC